MSPSTMDANNPISPASFSLAIHDLPIDALHSKAAEIRNSITHLHESNSQMLPFADEGDQDCKEAMFENVTVIGRMNERLALLRQEVEMRGLPWSAEGEDVDDGKADSAAVNGVGSTALNGVVEAQEQSTQDPPAPRAPSGRLTDEELRRQLEAQMGTEDDEDDAGAGVHL